MHKTINPGIIAKPFGHYSHAVEIPAAARRLYISGQVGVLPNGTMAEGFDKQAEWAWKNLLTILKSANMDVEDIVKYNTFLIDPDDVPAFRRIRDQVLDDVRPAATLLIIPSLASSEWLIEIEAVAAESS
jgi:enamine deaminase RidA (YjgF/YER057c/UK114 family)